MIVRINGHAYELAEKTELKTELKTEFLSLMFPVGAVMILTTDVDPNKTIGETWHKIKTGKFLEATENNAELKQEMQPGLPNATANIQQSCKHGQGSLPVMRRRESNQFSGYWSRGWRYEFNLSYASPIYGRSTTVQPSSIKVAMWQRIA